MRFIFFYKENIKKVNHIAKRQGHLYYIHPKKKKADKTNPKKNKGRLDFVIRELIDLS